VKYAVENALQIMVFIIGPMMTGSGTEVNTKVLPQQREASVVVLLMKGIYEVYH
jgi:hypothetical protein